MDSGLIKMTITKQYSNYKYSDYCFNIPFLATDTANFLLVISDSSLKIKDSHQLGYFYEVINNFPENLSHKYSTLHFF